MSWQPKLPALEVKYFHWQDSNSILPAPSKLGEAAFEQMKLPYSGKNEVGQYSTDEDILLRNLAPDYPI